MITSLMKKTMKMKTNKMMKVTKKKRNPEKEEGEFPIL